MRARSGAATPARNSSSVGGARSGKLTTCRQTTSGGAAISTTVTTSWTGGAGRGSTPTTSGTISAMPAPVDGWAVISAVVDVGADVPDRERDAEEQPGRVGASQIDPDADGQKQNSLCGGDAEQRALQPVINGGGWSFRGPFDLGPRRHERKNRHERVIHPGQEKEQRRPRRPARVGGPPHRHADPDPQERQRDQHKRREQPIWSAGQQLGASAQQR